LARAKTAPLPGEPTGDGARATSAIREVCGGGDNDHDDDDDNG
jgi:hypothetical protein